MTVPDFRGQISSHFRCIESCCECVGVKRVKKGTSPFPFATFSLSDWNVSMKSLHEILITGTQHVRILGISHISFSVHSSSVINSTQIEHELQYKSAFCLFAV